MSPGRLASHERDTRHGCRIGKLMARSTEALVDPSILIWARSSAGLSIEEAAAACRPSLRRCRPGRMARPAPACRSCDSMAAAYKRLLSDFYLPAAPQEEALPHDFRRLPGEVALRYSRALRFQLRLARQRRALALDLAPELDEVCRRLGAPQARRQP